MTSLKTTLSIVILILCLAPSCRQGTKDDSAQKTQNDSIPALGFWIEDYHAVNGEVKSGETFSGLMKRLGLEAGPTNELVHLCADKFDVRKLRAGNTFDAYYSPDTLSRRLEYLVYNNNRVRSTVFSCGDSLAVWTYDRPVIVERRTLDVTIRTSLWNDMIEAGSTPLLIVNLSDIFAWTVNFFGLQEGDRFRAIYQQKVCEGDIVEISKVEFSIYDSGSNQVCAIWFDQGDGGANYWNEKGESLRRAFLKAPLKYNRISSRFSYARKHPVTGKVKAHTAVDYAAPAGTPVHAIGDGKVLSAGWSGGGGNMIKLRHMNGYQTAYLHLSRFAKGIKAGATVSQGQVIGYVGSTGVSTGPHLDFRVWKDGKPVDPLKMISPPSEPIRKENLDSLKTLYGIYLKELENSVE